tara:strand:+ start:3229 stop:3735 length:507 start_codon:yes stop_codon:yes gene_type:complete
MSCGTYCYHNRWVSQPGRLRKLSRVQIQPGPTRDYGSTGALANSIRRRVMRPNTQVNKGYTKKNMKQAQGYGPLFGEAKSPGVYNKCKGRGKNFYKSNGGTGSDVVYWKKVAGGPRQLTSGNNCELGICGGAPVGFTRAQKQAACTKIKSGLCVLGGKKWLNFRRGIK